MFFDLGIPYLQERALDVNDGATISFEPAVEYQFAADADLEVGWNSGAVTITVGGTEEAPVVFRGEGEEEGFWGGVYIRNNVRTDSTLSHLQIEMVVVRGTMHSRLNLRSNSITSSSLATSLERAFTKTASTKTRRR